MTYLLKVIDCFNMFFGAKEAPSMGYTRLRGFGSMVMTREGKIKQREIAKKGGKAVHQKGTAHEWTSGPDGTAVLAGRKGGLISHGGRGRLVVPPQGASVSGNANGGAVESMNLGLGDADVTVESANRFDRR